MKECSCWNRLITSSDKSALRMKLAFRPASAMIMSFLTILLLCQSYVLAKPASVVDAERAVKGWLKRNSEPMGVKFGKKLKRTEAYSDANGQPIYYAVYIEPSGFVIVPADELVEPIIAFVEKGIYDPSEENPLGALVSRDVPARIAAVFLAKKT
jgi:hypothetical protein